MRAQEQEFPKGLAKHPAKGDAWNQSGGLHVYTVLNLSKIDELPPISRSKL
jgi:hypothetical protein